ncbi:putative bifunctional diguanylate cyclase/phosphodiesterase [Marinobacter sp. JSM 1782161]|uniref:putative bifunctional diguanylate cyclase/phosphodiesterase n=1 Tax=Marinobacter sp. JSM 1782161 TaxID=2685906 RepID=UPI001402029A|nr:sensor domain-containing phosphodiesterase [Marinobacter sp. JSM 1782161]
MSQNKTFIDFHEALLRLSHRSDFINDNRSRKLAALSELAGQLLQVERVSFWKMNPEDNRIDSEVLFRLGQGHDYHPIVLTAGDNPDYFRALRTARVIDAGNARDDYRTRDFNEKYFKPLGIHSLLDAPIFDGGRLSGVICLEAETPRTWTLPEISFATAIADTVSLINTHEAWIRSQKQLDYVTHYDSLTGLPNLQSCRERIHTLIQKMSRRQDEGFTLLWIDLDRLKAINDGMGAAGGNRVIAEIANRLRNLYLEGRDKLARIGGDEFAMLIRHQGNADLKLDHLVQQIQHAVSDPIVIDDRTLRMTASIGVCQYPRDGLDTEALLRSGEAAMYHAKESGRARMQTFHSDLHSTARSRFALESELRQAISQHTLDVFYQPIIEAGSQAMVATEALVRWNHPQHGWMSPIEFLDVARNAGLMQELGESVLRRVCLDHQEAARRGHDLPTTAINLAAEQIMDDRLPRVVAGMLDEYGINGHQLQFEVTEDAIKGDSKSMQGTLNELVALGCNLSIDDFGTGYSSLSRLKHLPFSRLKIDRSFIRDIPDDADDCAITLSILGLARGLGMQVVGEGVETEEQRQWLTVQGCNLLQGYLFSKPVPIEALLEYSDRRLHSAL